jgi:hypothetical protein
MPNPSATITRNQSTANSTQTLTKQSLSTNPAQSKESMKSIYQADQQVKFLHLQAEVETLLLELQTLKQHRHLTSDRDVNSLRDAARDRN